MASLSNLTASFVGSGSAASGKFKNPALSLQHDQLQKIKSVFGRVEAAATQGSTVGVGNACKVGKEACEEALQFIKIADVKGADVAVAFPRAPWWRRTRGSASQKRDLPSGGSGPTLPHLDGLIFSKALGPGALNKFAINVTSRVTWRDFVLRA